MNQGYFPDRHPFVAHAVNAEHQRAALARLLAVAGHDLRQPLTVAILLIDAARKEKLGDLASRRLEEAGEALRRLGSELDTLATVSASEVDLTPRRSAFPVQDLLRHAEEEWRTYAQERDIDFRVVRSTEVVESDRAMLLTIIRNLIGNAFKFSRAGGRVVLGCRRKSGNLEIQIHDNGCGIDTESLSKIFDAFGRGDQDTATQGLGLGLFLVKQTAELLRHHVEVCSIQGVGSTFTVTVPRPRARGAK